MGNAKLYDLRKHNHQQVVTALREALEKCDRDVDGIVIMMATENGRRSERVIAAGSMADLAKASYQTGKLQIALLTET